MSPLETIHDLRDELSSDTQAHARIAKDYYNNLASEADNEADKFEYKSKAYRAEASWWVCQAEVWCNHAERDRNRTWGGAAEAAFAARESEAEADNCAARADIHFDRSVYYLSESKRLAAEAE